jgi:hypothetical protein
MATAPVSATVEVLTAEVRVLMVGSRQVTLSVYRQLDYCEPEVITPFGRVRDKDQDYGDVYVIGVDDVGSLVKSNERRYPSEPVVYISDLIIGTGQERDRYVESTVLLDGEPIRVNIGRPERYDRTLGQAKFIDDAACATAEERMREAKQQHAAEEQRAREWEALPLIVLAGLR